MSSINTSNSIVTPEGYQIIYVEITPALAEELLDANTNNRAVRASNLQKIESDMLSGRWVFNGDSIRIDSNGVIIDGQHRLLSIEKTGVTVSALLVTGLPPETRATIDTNAVRTAGDELHMLGYTSANGLAALAAAFIRRQRGDLRAAVDPQNNKHRAMAVSTSMILEAVRSNPEIQELNRTSSTRNYKVLSRTLSSTLYMEFCDLPDPNSQEDADFFFARLRDGVGLDSGSPILKLRNALDGMHSKKSSRPSSGYIAGLTIKAWNAFRQGASIRQLTYRQGGASPESFPTPV